MKKRGKAPPGAGQTEAWANGIASDRKKKLRLTPSKTQKVEAGKPCANANPFRATCGHCAPCMARAALGLEPLAAVKGDVDGAAVAAFRHKETAPTVAEARAHCVHVIDALDVAGDADRWIRPQIRKLGGA